MTDLKEFQHFEQKPFIKERNVFRYVKNMLTMFDIRDTTGGEGLGVAIPALFMGNPICALLVTYFCPHFLNPTRLVRSISNKMIKITSMVP